MSELKNIFNSFDKYEEAVSNEVDYKIKMRNDKRRVGNTMVNKDYRVIINKIKAKEALYNNILNFVSLLQNKMTQNKMTQNKMTQNKSQTRTSENGKKHNKTRRSIQI